MERKRLREEIRKVKTVRSDKVIEGWLTDFVDDVPIGSLVKVRYWDHAFFKNTEPASVGPVEVDAYGVLDYRDRDHVRLVVQRYGVSGGRKAVAKITGLVILRSTIREFRQIQAPSLRTNLLISSKA